MHKEVWNWKPISRYAFRFDGGGAESAPAETDGTTPSAPKSAPQGTTDGNGSTPSSASQATPSQAEEKPFKTFASEADYQKEVDFKVQQALKTHEEKLKGKLTPEIRKQLEKEANMTAEQKDQEQLKQLEDEKKSVAKEKVRVKVESLFSSKGISEEDRQPMLDAVVDDDEEESTKRAKALIASIENAANEKVKAQMAKVKVPNSGKETHGQKSNENIGKLLGHQLSEARKSASKAIDYYTVGGNRK